MSSGALHSTFLGDRQDAAPVGPCILITGATGFVGGALLASLARSDARLVALVRGGTEAEARARLLRSVARFVTITVAEDLVRRVTLVVGDLAEEGTLEHVLFDEVTLAVHAAACTSFVSSREAWRTNVVGTTLLLERLRRSARLERLLHVSTAYCCGDRPRAVVQEDDSPSTAHSYVNEYTRSKAEAERLVLAAAGDVPVLVARPSVVIGHTTLGVGPSSSLFWYYRALAALGTSPFRPDARRDIVPVDYVADALAFLLRHAAPRFRTYHVSAGARACVKWSDVRRELGAHGDDRTVSPAALGDAREVRHLVCDDAQARHLARGLVACAELGALGVDYFDNTRLLAEGFCAPPSFLDYLPRCVESSRDKPLYEQMVDDL